jgi:hypothetical protein
MPSYTLQDQAFKGTRKTGNHLIHYPETCKEQPTDQTDFNRFMVEMDSTFPMMMFWKFFAFILRV